MKNKSLKLVYWFHGHSCPMSTLGFRAGALAKKLLKIKRTQYFKTNVKVYFRSCAIDGIQISYPATMANNNIFIDDKNSFVFEFNDTENKRMIRISYSKALLNIMTEFAEIKKSGNKSKIDKYFKRFIKFAQTAPTDLLFNVEDIKI